MNNYDVSSVFGITEPTIRNVKSVISRVELDSLIEECKRDRKHIVIYGGSKQGKTTLFRQTFEQDEYINIQCSDIDSIDVLYRFILNKAGVETVESITKETSYSGNINFTGSGKSKIPLVAEAEIEGGIEGSVDKSKSVTLANRFADLTTPQNIIDLLESVKFNKYIKLENFHYLSQSVQKKLAQDLRTFSENNIIFIILGVWTQQDSLFLKNLDLNGRMKNVTVEPWLEKDLRKIMKKGSEILEISIPEEIQNGIIRNSFGNVGLLQEICQGTIIDALKSSEREINITNENLESSLKKKQEEELVRINQFFNLIFEVNNSSNRQYIPYLFCRSLLRFDTEELSKGIDIKSVYSEMKTVRKILGGDIHIHALIEITDVTEYLIRISNKQKEAELTTPIIDYNKASIGSEVTIIDKYFLFCLNRLSEDDFEKIVPTPKNSKKIERKKSELKIDDTAYEDKIKKLEQEVALLKSKVALEEIDETLDFINEFDEIYFQEPTVEELKEIENNDK